MNISEGFAKVREEKQESQRINENEISTVIIGCTIEVHKKRGPGLLESA